MWVQVPSQEAGIKKGEQASLQSQQNFSSH